MSSYLLAVLVVSMTLTGFLSSTSPGAIELGFSNLFIPVATATSEGNGDNGGDTGGDGEDTKGESNEDTEGGGTQSANTNEISPDLKKGLEEPGDGGTTPTPPPAQECTPPEVLDPNTGECRPMSAADAAQPGCEPQSVVEGENPGCLPLDMPGNAGPAATPDGGAEPNPGFDPSTAGTVEFPPDPVAPDKGVSDLLEETSPDLTLPSQDESSPVSHPGDPVLPADQAGDSNSLDTQSHPLSPPSKFSDLEGTNYDSNIDPGTNTIPAEEKVNEKCVFFVFSCVQEPILDPGGAKPLELRDDEICRNGIDDNGNGRVDEEPYCTVIPGESGPPKEDTTLTPIPSTGPSPFGP